MATPKQLSFFDLATRYEALSHHGDPLETLAAHVPWEAFRPALQRILRRSKRKNGGRPPFDAVLMFKILVLQALYNLSDDQTELQIRDRLSFMRFLGLDLDQRIPDAKTIWLFRETLAHAQVVETLFAQFEAYLAEQGLQPRGGQLIDASLIPVPKQRNSRDDNATLKAGECPTEWARQPAKRRQKDTDARWTVKHGENHYGYKNHVNVDNTHKLIGGIRSRMRRSMTVRCSRTCYYPPKPDGMSGPTRRIGPRPSKTISKPQASVRRFIG